jgi:hypothetical protein
MGEHVEPVLPDRPHDLIGNLGRLHPLKPDEAVQLINYGPPYRIIPRKRNIGRSVPLRVGLVLRGLADESLLDTYELERRPQATAITHMAVGLGAIANMHDPDAAARRDAAFQAGDAPPPPVLPTVADGVLHHQPDGTITPSAGSVVPQGRVTAGDRTGRFDDVAGRGFVLVADTDVTEVLTPEQRGFVDELGCRIVRLGHDVIDEDSVHTTYLRELGALAYIARPDFVLFGAAADTTELSDLVDELRTAVAWAAAPSAVEPSPRLPPGPARVSMAEGARSPHRGTGRRPGRGTARCPGSARAGPRRRARPAAGRGPNHTVDAASSA